MYVVYWCDENGEEQSQSFAVLYDAQDKADDCDSEGLYATIRREVDGTSVRIPRMAYK